MLTCYSAVLYLLFTYVRNETVTPADAQKMVSMTPTERVEFVADQLKGSSPADSINNFLVKYERFLEVTSASEVELIRLFSDEMEKEKLREEQSEFGDMAYTILYSIGHDNRLYRRLLI